MSESDRLIMWIQFNCVLAVAGLIGCFGLFISYATKGEIFLSLGWLLNIILWSVWLLMELDIHSQAVVTRNRIEELELILAEQERSEPAMKKSGGGSSNDA